jgi:hypothetical protein
VIYRLTASALRAVCVAMMLATPALMAPGTEQESREIVALIVLFAGVFVFIEYAAASPSLLEFRDAPPFNRIRFLTLTSTLVMASAILHEPGQPSTFRDLLHALGFRVAGMLDVPYSPVRLLVLSLGDTGEGSAVRAAAGLASAISLLGLGIYLAALRLGGRPSGSDAANVWINLPTFYAGTGGDIVQRLRRDGRVSIGLGLVLPFLSPVLFSALLRLSEGPSGPAGPLTPHTTVWLVAGWSFLPTAFVMRGIAMARLARMIAEKRRCAAIEGPRARLVAL